MIFIAFPVGTSPVVSGNWRELSPEEIDYVTEMDVGHGDLKPTVLHTYDGGRYHHTLQLDENFEEIDAEEKRAFLRDKLREDL
ncbi:MULTISPECIES: hypothetical protein [Paenibacillus]|uniref:hypothetical protein n=1 Tax=Paenibacillus TaxID=44249 RepID=UPI00038FD64E|nr:MULTISPECIES: hypothetical protein [Paenibacillus]CDN42071.1 hypothetical protein BN871_AT_00730 [Paenibacillus sp. P22]